MRDPRPVVVVGSMRNPSTLGYEGAANLLEGVRVAAAPAARGKGVLVVLNDEINSARDVTKTDALRLQTFRSPTHGVLGIVDRDQVVIFRADPAAPHRTRASSTCARLTTLPRVDVVMVYQGATGDVIKALVDLGAKGIVIAGAGAGATSGTQNEGIDYAAEKGVFVVTATRTGAGRIAPNRGQGGPDAATLTPAQQRRRAFSHLGRRPHPRQGAHPADAGADQDQRPRRDSADLQRILTPARRDGATRPRRPDSGIIRSLSPPDGPVAQLGARLNGIQEVTGSIPVRSTTFRSRHS